MSSTVLCTIELILYKLVTQLQLHCLACYLARQTLLVTCFVNNSPVYKTFAPHCRTSRLNLYMGFPFARDTHSLISEFRLIPLRLLSLYSGRFIILIFCPHLFILRTHYNPKSCLIQALPYGVSLRLWLVLANLSGSKQCIK